MRVQCSGCQSAFTIPDERVPAGKSLRLHCPKCKAPIDIEKPGAEPGTAVPAQEPDASIFSMAEYLSDDSQSVDVVDEGIKTSLLCVSDQKIAEAIGQTVQELDFYLVSAPNTGFALGKLNHNHYDLILLDENFDSTPQSGNLVLQHIQFLPMPLRRQFFLCLISQTLPTLDATISFKLGVNLVLNARDLDKAKIILARSMKEHRTFYNLYSIELAKKGLS